MHITVDPVPRLDPRAFVTRLPGSLGDLPSPDWLIEMLHSDAALPFAPDERVRAAIRDALRGGGYKPTGRGKPASEYLARAARDGTLRSINLAVDACNAVSLHSGLPISVVDLDALAPPLRIGVAGPAERYVFNASGQEIEVAGLPCLFDTRGACANAVKDAQRTKTSHATRATLSVIWSEPTLTVRTDAALSAYRELLGRAGASVEPLQLAR